MTATVLTAGRCVTAGVDPSGFDAESLAERVIVKEHEIYPLAARWFLEGRLRLGEDGGAYLDGQRLAASGVDYQPGLH